MANAIIVMDSVTYYARELVFIDKKNAYLLSPINYPDNSLTRNLKDSRCYRLGNTIYHNENKKRK